MPDEPVEHCFWVSTKGRLLCVTGAVKTLDRYILREWLTVFGLVAALTVGLLLIQAMFDDFRDLLGMKAGFVDMMTYFAFKVPTFLAVVLPIIVLVSLIYSLGQLHRSQEITAMRAAGLGFFRITRSIWIAGLLLCGVMGALNAWVVPRAVEASRQIFEAIELRHQTQTEQDASQAGLVRTVTFENLREHRLWVINRYSRLTGRAYGATIIQMDANGRELRRYFARQATFDSARGHWVLRDGWISEFDPETGDVAHPPPFKDLPMASWTERPSLMLIFDLKPTELSFNELREIIGHLGEENPKAYKYSMRYYGLVADTLAPLIVIAIAVSFTMTGVRVNPAVGVSKCLGLFLLYYVVLQFANAIGSRGIVEPAIAAAFPSIAMLGVGGWYFSRLR